MQEIWGFGVLGFWGFGAALHYETPLEQDAKFARGHAKELNQAVARLDSYFQSSAAADVLVQLGSQSGSSSCSRIFQGEPGKERIFIESPAALAALAPAERSKFKAFCLKRTYEDLPYTIAHEYVHVLALRREPTHQPAPEPWLWEGSAVALSGQLSTALFKTAARDALKRRTGGKLAFCEPGFAKDDAYAVGGLVLAWLEKARPGVILKLLDFRGASASAPLRDFFEREKLPCDVPAAELLRS